MITISKKAYAGFINRIEDVLAVQSSNPQAAQIAIVAVDSYIRDGQLPAADSVPMEVFIVFSMLRPEIDKAAERSRRARERAAERRDKASKTSCNARTTTDTITPDTISTDTVHSDTIPSDIPSQSVSSQSILNQSSPDQSTTGQSTTDQPTTGFPVIMKNRRLRRKAERENLRELRRFKRR